MKRWTEEHKVKMREVTCLGKLRLLSLFDLLQDIAVKHASALGLGYQSCFEKGVSWVGSSYKLKINRLPVQDEEIHLETWISGIGAASSLREYKATDKEGNVLFRGATQWVLISLETLRPIPIAKHLSFDKTLVDEETMLSEPFARLKVPERTDFKSEFVARFDETDVNGHINNTVYPMWAAEAVPEEWKYQKEPTFVEINFKRPIKSGQSVVVRTEMNETKTLHSIDAQDGTAVLIEICWKNIVKEA